MTPQQKRVLAAARSFKGTCSADWIDGLGADGRGKISRVPARIEELAELYGCVFECIGWRNKTKVYRLISGPDVESGAGNARGPAQEGVSDPEPAPSSPALSACEDRLFDPPSEPTGHWSRDAAA